MNYLLKRQPSPGGIVECLLNNTKHSSTKYCFCGTCLQPHPVFRINGQECRSSTYVSALEVQLDKKRISKKSENVSKRVESLSNTKRLPEMLKIVQPKLSAKKIMSYEKKLSYSSDAVKTLGWKSRYNVDCTKSYDPNLLNCGPEMEQLNPCILKKNSLQTNSHSGDMKYNNNSNIRYQKFQNVNSSLQSSHLSSYSVKKPHRVFSNPQISIKDLGDDLKLNLSKVNVSKLPIKINKQKTVKSGEVDFDKFTVNLFFDYEEIQFLHSCIDICTTNGMIKEAYQLFQNFRKRGMWKQIVMNNSKIAPDMYNSLLYALSSKGYWYLMKTVVNWMEEDRLKLNCESFAALLDCLAKIRESGNEEFVLQEISKVLNSIFGNNISLNDIFCKTTLSKDACEKILAIVRQVIPSFEIKPDIMELSSDCSLLKNLHTGPSNLQPQLEGVEVEDMQRLVDEQLLMEKNFYVDVKAVSSGLLEEVSYAQKEKVEKLREQWREDISAGINTLIKVQKNEYSKAQETFNIYHYLNSLPTPIIANILLETTQNILQFSRGFSPSTTHFHKMIGKKVFQCYQLRKKDVAGFTEKTEKLFKKYIAWYVDPSGPAMNSRQKWQMVIQDSEKLNQLDMEIIKWPNEVITKLGKVLFNVILNEVKFTSITNSGPRTLPVFSPVLRNRENSFREEIKCHPFVTELLESVGFDILHFRSEEIPMVCPPKPWKSPEHGGYLFLTTAFIRKTEGVQGKTVRLKDVPVKQLYATFDSLNALQSVPWMINEDVLDVALEVFRSGGSEKLNVPLFPEKRSLRQKFFSEISYEERKSAYSRKMELAKSMANNYALWCEALYRLSLANHFRKRIFWMPQNCDFRGRVYPVPPLVNHLGSDLFRSLLVFAKGKPLGPKGLDWLKIHLINLTGTHKRKSLKERLAYANEILPVILDSAERPLTGSKWWTESEEPWQTLASCIELKKAISHPNPEKYICRFPVHQDGSCNGLQHYAALGRDLVGAQSVNLTPCDEPQDVYTVVARLVEEERAKDASEGVRIAQVLEGFVGRKIVKQTIMTTVYGVTPYGAKLQIKKQLKEIPNFSIGYRHLASIYLTDKTFLCLTKMFSSAKQIQEWFVSCASEICRRKDYVQWMSPLGLPVVQYYAKEKINIFSNERAVMPDEKKQRNAFPPNFIHSLDSCHMMLTSLYCEQAGLTFAAVHDCFWTHPNTVDIMNRICREQFISLHSKTILQDLSQFFKKTYVTSEKDKTTAKIFESIPENGSFDIKEVLNSVYFFS